MTSPQLILEDARQYQPKIANHYDKLTSGKDKEALLEELRQFPSKEWTRIYRNIVEEKLENRGATESSVGMSAQELNLQPPFRWIPTLKDFEPLSSEKLSPAPPNETVILTTLNAVDSECTRRWRRLGLQSFAQGAVATVIMAGGQSTRLGGSIPKGCVVATPISEKSLFQIFCERLQRLKALSITEGFEITADAPLYIMTSREINDSTISFFKEHDYFGLNPSCVTFFEQSLAPTFDLQGNFLLKNATTLAKNPDGNGGIFRTLKEKGILKDMHQRDVSYLHIFSVDNILCKVADPVFIGYCLFCKAGIGNKCVTRSGPYENVGVFCSKNISLDGSSPETSQQRTGCVVEYSELSDDVRHSLDKESNTLLFSAGNICNHVFSLSIMDKLAESSWMQHCYHIAYKVVPFYDTSKRCVVNPNTKNAIKLERFIFDAFECHRNIVGLEVAREEEFSPIKNAHGADSPETAAAMVSALHNTWIKKAKIVVAPLTPETKIVCEVSPLLSYEGEGIDHLRRRKCLLSYPIYLADPERPTGSTKVISK
ncbi:UTP-glucose-1-phosphate uridylyltransferase subfamily protein [Cardiosporidium cionae]|uniref:UDP-N-acetylglucosamine diphosphorylase n=1 Tax=Cardiosporidium cionae TaxID=476202 RepID=A0ABQ7J9U9_9APIC|nr:UTP-glucose-1-phosphate uridylyltransferase subfamily protein [Cardiosporidium cionae]|eukprot:KAF8820752.1 UTP-glucose-1-phosphate uridylyltransferase subfamily protein [Cardiosporidium cionae]